tara:strand:+ start:2706 stop:4463 length:1758 start_codon:yes stop_codon:yes gene_type:complete
VILGNSPSIGFHAWRRTVGAIHRSEFLGRKGFVVLWLLLAPAMLLAFQAIVGLPSVENYMLGTSWILPGMVGVFATVLAADLFSRDEQSKFGDHLACLPVGSTFLWSAKVSYLLLASAGFLAWTLLSQACLAWFGSGWPIHMELAPAPEAIFTALLAVGLSVWLTGMTRQPLLAWLGALMFTCPLWTLGGVMMGDWYGPILETLMRPQYAGFLLVGLMMCAAMVYRPGSDRGMRLRRVSPGVIVLGLIATTGTAWGHQFLMETVLVQRVHDRLEFRSSPDGQFLLAFRYQERRLYHRGTQLEMETTSESRALNLDTREHQVIPYVGQPFTAWAGTWQAPCWDSDGNFVFLDDRGMLCRFDLDSGSNSIVQHGACAEAGGRDHRGLQVSREFDTWFRVDKSPDGYRFTFEGHATDGLHKFRGVPLEQPGHFAVVKDDQLVRLDISTGEEIVWIESVWEYARPYVSPCGCWFWLEGEGQELTIFDVRAGEVLMRRSGLSGLRWSSQPGRVGVTHAGWIDLTGVHHKLDGLAEREFVRAEIGADLFLLQAPGEHGLNRFELYSIRDGSRTPLSLDDFGFETLTTGSIQ